MSGCVILDSVVLRKEYPSKQWEGGGDIKIMVLIRK